MSVAKIHSGEADKLKFTVSNKLGKSLPSFYLKGNRELLTLQIRPRPSGHLLT